MTAASQPVFYDARLQPFRSLPPRGFALVMLVLGGASFILSVGCVVLGAWPITGFFGLDVALVYVAFRASYRSARKTEHLRLTQDEMTVERIGVRGDRRAWRFEPFWLRLIFEEPDEDSNRLYLASHGKTLSIGSFLAPTERKKLYLDLKHAFARWRASLAGR
jgi:uncharacterized membrane protein